MTGYNAADKTVTPGELNPGIFIGTKTVIANDSNTAIYMNKKKRTQTRRIA